MKNRKQVERRTFLQDRFDILLKKQKDGRATFAELTELDDIVNRSTLIRKQILEEMQGFGDLSDDEMINNSSTKIITRSQKLLDKIKILLGSLFNLKFSGRRSQVYLKNVCFAV